MGALAVNRPGGSTSLTLQSNDASTSAIFFGDQTSATVGRIEYNHATDDMPFRVAGNEAMRLNSTGLGIGTNNPSYRLDVNGSARINTGGVLRLFRSDGTTEGLSMQAGTANNFITATTGGLLLQGNSGLSIDVTGNVLWRDNGGGNERMRLDAAGNLGLGVTPNSTGTFGRALQLGRLTLNVNSLSGRFNSIASNAYNDGSWRYIASSVPAVQIGLDNNDGSIQFFIAPSGTAGNAISFTQAMTLNANGALSIGTTSVYNSAANRGNISVEGSNSAIVNFAVSGTNRGYAFTDGNNFDLAAEGSRSIRLATNGTIRALADATGNVVVGNGAIATNATDGFLYVPTCAGTPTGTPTTYTGRSPIVVDSTNNKLYFYSGGEWRDAGP